MRPILIGELVEVPEPTSDDIWNHSFVGTVRKIKNGIATVIDEDDDAYDVEIERLTRA